MIIVIQKDNLIWRNTKFIEVPKIIKDVFQPAHLIPILNNISNKMYNKKYKHCM